MRGLLLALLQLIRAVRHYALIFVLALVLVAPIYARLWNPFVMWGVILLACAVLERIYRAVRRIRRERRERPGTGMWE